MSRIRLYMDEDSTARSLVLALQNRGVDVITSLNLNRLGFSINIQKFIHTQFRSSYLY
jgi:hypothetical protein